MDSTQRKILISFKKVVKIFSKKRVLNKLSFDIEENDFIALIGNNGCGKTTTINILCNLINYDFGEVTVFGLKIDAKYISYKNNLGIVLSSPYLIKEFTQEDYLSFVGQFQLLSKDEVKVRVHEVIKLFELDEFKSQPIKNLSSGTQMKITLASALIHNPEILVLDEPFISLDIGMQEFIKHLLKSFKGKKTLLITSHNLDLVADICDTFLIMDNGKIISRIEKKENTDIDTLKDEIKGLLSKNDQKMDLAWLK